MKFVPRAVLAVLCCCMSPAFADYTFKLNGFATAGYAQSNSPFRYYRFIDQTGSFQADSLIGLQGAFQIDDQTSVIAQAVGSGQVNNYDLRIDWAYVSYTVDPDLKVRAGRIRRPVYMLSDYLNVGYAYPWVRPPQEVYGLNTISTTSGVDAVYKLRFVGVDWTVQPYGGTERGDTRDVGASDFTLKKSLGLNLTGSVDDVTFRVGGSHSYMDNLPNQSSFITSNGGVALVTFRNEPATFRSYGLSIDKNYMVMAEYVQRRADIAAVPDRNASYVTVGYHFGKYLPHVTVAKQNSVDSAPNRSQDSLTVGVRYELNRSTALKLEAEQITLTNGGTGLFLSPTSNATATPTEDRINLYSIAVSTTF